MQLCKRGAGVGVPSVVPAISHPPPFSLSPNPDPQNLRAPSPDCKPQLPSGLRVRDLRERCPRPQPERARERLRVCERHSPAPASTRPRQGQGYGGGGSYGGAPSGRCPKLGGRLQAESRGGHVTPTPGTNQRPQEGGHTRRPHLSRRAPRETLSLSLCQSSWGAPNPRAPTATGGIRTGRLSPPTEAPPPRPAPWTRSGPGVRLEWAQGHPRCGGWTAEWGGGASPGRDHRTGSA